MTTSSLTRGLPVLQSAGRRLRSPFAASLPSILLAILYAVASLTWVVAGDVLPGGRWLAIHLFTVGVLSNLVLTFSQHFASTVTRAPGIGSRVTTPVYNLGALLLIAGLPAGLTWAVALGATIATGAVLWSYVHLRNLRRSSIGARFGWIVRVYERAHGAFVHGAILGALMGAGVLSGRWYGTARLAHLHVMVLGWGGLTLLATLVFFGPSMARTRIRDGADARAAQALRWGATALTVAVLALLASGVGGTPGTALRVLAGVGFGRFAAAATAVIVPVAVAANRAGRTAAQVPLLAISGWTIAAVWADVAIVTVGAWSALDVVGVTVLVGVLGQAILTTLSYLAPMLRARAPAGRTELVRRIERGAAGRSLVFNTGVLALVAGQLLRLAGADGTLLTRAAWTVLAVALALQARAVFGRTTATAAGPTTRV